LFVQRNLGNLEKYSRNWILSETGRQSAIPDDEIYKTGYKWPPVESAECSGGGFMLFMRKEKQARCQNAEPLEN
jgi:hypothetical protein